MSEDVKPKQFWVYMGDHALLASSLPASFNDGTHVYHVIELEPTMRMMDDLANKLQSLDDLIGDLSLSPNPESNTIRMEITYDILEKYRKFKEGLK